MKNERLSRLIRDKTELINNEKHEVNLLEVGEAITIADREHRIERVSLAKDLGEKFGLVIPDNVPIYWLSDSGGRRKGAYVPEKNIVLFFDNTDEATQHHELTHAVEYHQEPTQELLALYDRVRATVTEDSFEGGYASFNFMKNIHEFIADGRTKPSFIAALKNEGLHDEFVKETAYLFVNPTESE